MTLNANLPFACTMGPTDAPQTTPTGARTLDRRRNLLKHLAGLPERTFTAGRGLRSWLCEQWWEALANTDQVDEALALGIGLFDAHFRPWFAYALGGADTYARTYDLPPGRLPELVAFSMYANDLSVSPAGARLVRRNLEGFMTDMPVDLYAVYRLGQRNSGFWLEDRFRRQMEPHPHRRQTPPPRHTQPPGYTDLLEMQLARQHGRLQ